MVKDGKKVAIGAGLALVGVGVVGVVVATKVKKPPVPPAPPLPPSGLATFDLYLRGAPTGYTWWASIDGETFTPKVYTHHSLTLTAPPTTSILIQVFSETRRVFDEWVTGKFNHGGIYVFDMNILKFELLGIVHPYIGAVKIPEQVAAGSVFSVEATVYLPNPWMEGMPYYSVGLDAGDSFSRLHDAFGLGYGDKGTIFRARAINPTQGFHTVTCRAAAGTSYNEDPDDPRVAKIKPSQPGVFPIIGWIRAARLKWSRPEIIELMEQDAFNYIVRVAETSEPRKEYNFRIGEIEIYWDKTSDAAQVAWQEWQESL